MRVERLGKLSARRTVDALKNLCFPSLDGMAVRLKLKRVEWYTIYRRCELSPQGGTEVMSGITSL